MIRILVANSQRFQRALVAVVVVLALNLAGILTLFRTASHEHTIQYFELTLKALRVEGEQNFTSAVGKDCQKKVSDEALRPSAETVNGSNSTSSLGFWDVLNQSYVNRHVLRPWIGAYQCKDVICSEFLHEHDWKQMDRCKENVKKKSTVLQISPRCHFMNGTSRAGAALLSFPGSGNTWLRGLLEKATGVCTGSVFCDRSIWQSGSVGEGIRSSNVLLVKLHKVTSVCTKQSSSGEVTQSYNGLNWNQTVILLVRNPFDAIASYYKWYLYQHDIIKAGNNAHVSHISTVMFRNHSRRWGKFVERHKGMWSHIIKDMAEKKDSGCPVLVVQYENIKRNRTKEVLRILNFLGMSYSPQEVRERLMEDVTTFHRSNQDEDVDPYTPKQRELVQKAVKQVLARLQHANDEDMLGIAEYLDSV